MNLASWIILIIIVAAVAAAIWNMRAINRKRAKGECGSDRCGGCSLRAFCSKK